ncbi:MAG: bifunctional diaminohydroxyphosphoribosylaminopyrimidine deaminase/5-amino-6-(5-phosphoribosylamino)uracil reductase RibD [Amaricoccus sp.]
MSDGARDAGWMRAALALARRGLGGVWPNPSVGCILVKDGRVVGRGRTGAGGRPHAEAAALAQAGALAKGATCYVTLEPCVHTGQTPPCSAALIAAGVARVVVAIEDPDPRVNGRGVEALRTAGIAVEVGCLATEAVATNRGFLTRVTAGRPMVTLKLASSLDGRIATGTGESRWITGPAARAEVHLMRAQSDAVLVGAGTVRSDNPRLDVRDLGIRDANPVRVVVSGALSLPRDGHLAETAKQVPLWLCHDQEAEPARRQAWTEAGAELIEIPFQEDDQLDLAAMMQALGDRGLTRVLCEGGGRLAAALIEADLVDEVVVFTAGVVLGAEAIPSVAALDVPALQLAPRFRLLEAAPIGPDMRSRWRRRG